MRLWWRKGLKSDVDLFFVFSLFLVYGGCYIMLYYVVLFWYVSIIVMFRKLSEGYKYFGKGIWVGVFFGAWGMGWN